MASPFAGLTVVCLASYFKGVDFLRQCREHGCRVVLVVKEKLRDEAWPRESLDQFLTVPNDASGGRLRGRGDRTSPASSASTASWPWRNTT